MLRVISLAIFLPLLASEAYGAEAVVMVNMNYSSQELKAAREVAKARGQEFVVVPPEELIPLAEPLYKLRISLSDQVKKLRPGLEKQKVEALVTDFSRRGAASDMDPELTAALREDITKAYEGTKELAAVERRTGDLEGQVKKKLAALRARGVEVDTMILSGHSDGSNLTGESTVTLSSAAIDRLRTSEPQAFERPRHVLLLGCYNMTEKRHERWRNYLYPNATLIAGFGVQAPSRWRENAIKYIGQVLGTADELDKAMLAKNSPLDARFITTALRKLSSVTGTQSVIDYCFTMVEGQPGAGKIPCEEQWKSTMHQAKLITTEFMDLTTISSDPPNDENGGTLRNFYSQLQNTCPASKNPAIADEDKPRAERYRAAVSERAIRLINWANVQRNFQTYFGDDLKEVLDYLTRLKIDARLPALDGTASRLAFVRAHQRIDRDVRSAIEAVRAERDTAFRAPGGISPARRRDLDQREKTLQVVGKRFLELYRPLYALLGETSLNLGTNASVEDVLERGGVPFNWIENATVLEKRSK